eukprot:8755792-Pyramimonas_sp.AAC.1
MVNYDTWYEHHKEDFPHIKFCGRVAKRQDDLRRFYLRENQRGLGWMKYRHGRHKLSARALAR